MSAALIFWGVLPLLCWLLLSWNDIQFVIIPLLFRYPRTGSKLPPGSMGLPFFGEMFTFLWYFKFRRQPDEFINSKRRKYGDGVRMFRTHLFGSPSIIACFPAVSKFILRSSDKFIVEWPNSDLLGLDSIMVVNGEAHTRIRAYVLKAISRPDSLRRNTLIIQPRMRSVLQSWAKIGRINAYDELKKLTLGNTVKLFASLEGDDVLEVLRDLYHDVAQGVRAQPYGTTYHRGLRCRKKLEAIFKGELEKRKWKPMLGDQEDGDLMDGLMQIKDGEGNYKLGDKEIVENIVTLILVGHETVTLSSMWAIYYLSKYPDVLQKLQEENMKLRKTIKSDLIIMHEDVSKLKYTNKVVEETIRIANLSGFLFRLAIKEVEYDGYTIPKNWKVIVWLRYLHTDPDNFDNPMCFNPDRWNEPPRPGTFQAFSTGARACPGNMFARMQLALFLHHLSTGYKWKLVNPLAPISYLSHPKPMDGVEVVFSELGSEAFCMQKLI